MSNVFYYLSIIVIAVVILGTAIWSITHPEDDEELNTW